MLYARITIEIHRMMRFYVGQVRLCDIIFFLLCFYYSHLYLYYYYKCHESRKVTFFSKSKERKEMNSIPTERFLVCKGFFYGLLSESFANHQVQDYNR